VEKSIGVTGDLCKDIFVYGKCSRLVPGMAAPVFVPERTEINKGMAGNVSRNLGSLGCHSYFFGQEDDDCPHKTRYVDSRHNTLLMRIDTGEERKRIDYETRDKIMRAELDFLIISDYDKGFLEEEDIAHFAKAHKIFLDTKKILGPWARNIDYIKLNEDEYYRNKAAGVFDRNEFTNQLIVTLGSGGTDYKYKNYPVSNVEIVDTVGAGDTFMAALGCNYHETHCIYSAIEFANKVSTLVVQKKGVATVERSEVN